MARKNQSAGILLYRFRNDAVEFLLVHPGGPFFKNKDAGAWSVPKGLFEENEEPVAAACREFQEELGQPLVAAQLIPLTPIKQKGGKTVHVWAAEGDINTDNIHSNTFPLEYPPRSGRFIQVPEIDQAAWFNEPTARLKINPAQASLLDELLSLLRNR